MTEFKTVRLKNLWCQDARHDKLYRLEMIERDGRFDVFAVYGRRGGQSTIHVWAENLPAYFAANVFEQKLREKFRKGYREIQEDTLEVGKSVPTRV